MKTTAGITLGLLLGAVLGWAAGAYHVSWTTREVASQTSRFPAIRTYIARTVPFLRKSGAEWVEMEPVPYQGGGAILVRGSVRNGDEFYILHTMLENRLTNPDLPARLLWRVGLADTNRQDQTRRMNRI